jgi:drug/metabolite transporter (DMT)-like permease
MTAAGEAVGGTTAPREPLPVVARIMDRPALAAVAGALTIAFSSILVKLADVSPESAAIFRCLYALPVLGALAVLEDRRFGARARRDRWLAAGAGVFFAADLIFWHHAIGDVGAGLATVLGNLQVVIVPFAAWAILGERISGRVLAALPLVCSGVLLISGVLETGAYGEHPLRGVLFGFLTGVTYAGFILVLRQGSGDLRRPAGPLFDATAVSTVVAIVTGLAVGRAELVPSWPAHAWLVTLALSSQVLGWLLITVSLPRLPAALTSVTLTIQPVGSVLLGVILLGEEPSALQLLGVMCIVAGLLTVARRRSRTAEPGA